MKLIAISLFFSALIFTNVYSQDKVREVNTYCDSLSIQYIDLRSNKILYEEIKKFIVAMSDSSDSFKRGYGYISVGSYNIHLGKTVLASEMEEKSKDVVLSFMLSANSYLLVADSPGVNSICQDCFPLYYSLVNDRLVLLYSQDANWVNNGMYSLTSKRKVAGLVEETLKMSLESSFEFKGLNKLPYKVSIDKRKNMSKREVFEKASLTLNSARVFIRYFDGTVKYTWR